MASSSPPPTSSSSSSSSSPPEPTPSPPSTLAPPPQNQPSPTTDPPSSTPPPSPTDPPPSSPPPSTSAPPPAASPPPPTSDSPPPSVLTLPPPPAPSKNKPPPSPPATPPTNSTPPAPANSSPSPPSANPPTPPALNSPPPSGLNNTSAPPTAPSPMIASPTPTPTNSSSNAPVTPSAGSPSPLPVNSTPRTSTPSSAGRNKPSEVNPNGNGGPGSSSSATGGGGSKSGTAIAIGIISALVLLSLVGLAVYFVRRRKKTSGRYAGGYVMPSPYTSSQMSDAYQRSPSGALINQGSRSHSFMYSPSEQGLGNSKTWFTYEELSSATNGFSTQNLLGEGGFGCVYKGRLQDGREVAVKQLKVGGGQGEREFRAEVEIISRIHHRHLVSLVGYCIQDNQRLLVYDFVPNNTLHYHLHGRGRPPMVWATRVKVAAGSARGLAYLHEDCHPRIIHRDIKSSNILLDSNFEAKVADFGLARLAMDAMSHVTTRVMGTFGYLAPEYALTGKLTDKSDVYSFGVVLLELITGRRPVDDSQPLGDESLVEWARPLLNHAVETRDFGELPDPRLENNYNEHEMFRMIEAAAACIRHSAAMRPRMGQVARALESFSDVDLNNGMVPGQSALISAQSSDFLPMLFQRMAFGNFSTGFNEGNWSQSQSQSQSHSRSQL